MNDRQESTETVKTWEPIRRKDKPDVWRGERSKRSRREKEKKGRRRGKRTHEVPNP